MNKYLILAALQSLTFRTAGDTPVADLQLSGERTVTDTEGKQRNLRFFTQAEGLGKTADIIKERGYQPGDVLLIEGSAEYGEWTDKESGQKKSNVKLRIGGAVRKLGGIPVHTDGAGKFYALGGKNCLTVIGNLAADVDIRKTQRGDSVASVRIAVNEKFKRRNGEAGEKTHWITVEVWREQAEMLRGMTKGQAIYASGALVDDTYTDKEGKDVRVKVLQATEVYPVLYAGDAPQNKPAQHDQPAGEPDPNDLPF